MYKPGLEGPKHKGAPMTQLYCGLDFHKRTTTYHIVDQDGKTIEKGTLETKSLFVFFSRRQKMLIGIEASGGTNDAATKLVASGHDVRIINPNKFKAIGIGGKKTDERDAQMIADVLRLNYIPEVHLKQLRSRRLKSLVITREMLVRNKVNTSNHIRGQLREYGITIPAGVEQFMKLAPQAISRLDDPILGSQLQVLFELVKTFASKIAEFEAQIIEVQKENEDAQRLQTVTGIGTMTAAMLIAISDDISRFSSAKHFASYLGLVPREYSSGDKKRMGSITRSGSEVTRRYLIHGARTMLTCAARSKKYNDDPNLQWALALKKRVGMNKATVALAHRMARIAFAILRDKKKYGEVEKDMPRPRIAEFKNLAA